ncbi:MAG: HD domain-containing protein [Parasporobacterium sp.]|nr:HD domain-containing protein [Parasporobacterium sp.]
MRERIEYRNKIMAILAELDPEALAFNKDEFWLIQREFEYLEYYALEHRLTNTVIALHLAVGLHDGTYRKSIVQRDGETYRLPYVIHCLWVTKMLADLSVPIPRGEEDIMLAAALCHDMIEDIDFADGGKELYTRFHLDPEVYETVKLVSKRYDFTDEEEKAFFHGIESNKLALLVKLSDRCHNVEDLYNRTSWKVHEYVGETRKFFIPMCEYGLEHYPDINTTLQIFHEKMVNLTHAAEMLVDRYDARKAELTAELEELRKENAELKARWAKLWELE